MDDVFEPVHTLDDWYDGPRRGIADFCGRPHLFVSEWRDGEDLDADGFLLSPVDPETFVLALERHAIWDRWNAAFRAGIVTAETHPVLPEDRRRNDELEVILGPRLTIDPGRAIRSRADFRARADVKFEIGQPKLEVRWIDPRRERQGCH